MRSWCARSIEQACARRARRGPGPRTAGGALLLFAVLLAGAPATYAAGKPMDYDDARHLLLRTGFAPTDREVRDYAGLSREDGVDRLLRETRTTATAQPPSFAGDVSPLRYPNVNTAPPEERRAFQRQQTRDGLELRAWWVQEMLVTPSPLTERMTLFWHNHFVSSQQKVRFTRLMYAQNVTFRANAVGNFRTLLHAASKEPAMLVYLDGAQSRKQQPNENFAREVMELFTLGEGHYGESDIKEAARAFTGWSIDRETGTYLYRPGAHDAGAKTVLGATGNFDGDAVLDVILARPDASRFVVAKLWREFVSPAPDPREVERVAQIFRGRDYDLVPTLRALFLTPAFWDRDNRGTLVKSPVELVVGTLRQLEISPPASLPYAVAASGMGQNVFSPPNVRGWPGGEVWINSNTLLARKQFLDRIAANNDARVVMSDSVGTSMVRTTAAASTVATDDNLVELRAPRATIASPQGTPETDDKARAQAFNQAMDRALRNAGFNPARWVGSLPGATPLDRMETARRLMLPIDAVLAEPASAQIEPQALVRATLLDPAYQLK